MQKSGQDISLVDDFGIGQVTDFSLGQVTKKLLFRETELQTTAGRSCGTPVHGCVCQAKTGPRARRSMVPRVD
jgi:hypothetical protein